jgi:hypothetical protein
MEMLLPFIALAMIFICEDYVSLVKLGLALTALVGIVALILI